MYFGFILTKIEIEFYLQPSFLAWTNEIQDTLNFKKHGDSAFRSKDFAAAIQSYSKVGL